ncbi:MAG TPA: GDP-mannose mannosyl hydrolase [Geothermobacteraceae bacterium]|nr:GDP-mannose mannosyl hydrolase [Geothermobacteraceae bacterium]
MKKFLLLMQLQPDIFQAIVTHTPLVSIDLIVHDRQGRVLLGWRRNRPAQGCWFVPGGRVNKDESLAAAFRRLSRVELGVELNRDTASFRGVFEHFYSDCFAGGQTSTHYVVLAHDLLVDGLAQLPLAQHSDFRWFSPEELIADPQVHENVKVYFS